MAELRWKLELYVRMIGATVRAQLQYRVSFWLDMTGAFFMTFLDFAAIIILFSHLPRLAGWSFAEIAFFYGSANIAFATSDMLVGHLDQFPATIRDGTFD
ncbi:MAG: ABC-2 family transporter protein, partial [Chloroflexota bacterium]